MFRARERVAPSLLQTSLYLLDLLSLQAGTQQLYHRERSMEKSSN